MKVGDLVKPIETCGGLLGSLKCETAVVLSKELSHYERRGDGSVRIHEYELFCRCGIWEEYEDNLEMIDEDR
jgi:hypothetical protein